MYVKIVDDGEIMSVKYLQTSFYSSTTFFGSEVVCVMRCANK